MEKYEIFVNNGHLVMYEELGEFDKMFVDNRAVNEFNRVINKKLGKKFELKSKDNNVDKYIEKDNILVEFNDYIKIMQKLEKMKKQEALKKKRWIFGGGATAAASALMVTVLTAAGPKDVELESLHATPIEKSVDKVNNDTEDKNELESEEILSQEVAYDVLNNENVSNFTYSEDSFETRYDTETTIYVETTSNYDEKLERNVSEYDDIIKDVSEKWGVSDTLIRDIMKQESHGGTITNKMQIVFDAWKDQIIKVYNFNDNKYETIVLTDTPENYTKVGQTISREELNNPKTNISVGTLMLAYTYNQCDHNLPMTVQAYNFGIGAINQVMEAAAIDQGLSVDELKNDEANVSFMHYTDVKPASYGDHDYANKIFSKSTPESNLDDGKTYTMKYVDSEGNIMEKTVVVESAYNLNKSR